MPRETVHHGRGFATITVTDTDDRPGWTYEVPDHEAHSMIAADQLDKSLVEFNNKPRLDVVWQRPLDGLSLPPGEDPSGAVQVEIILNPTDMRHRIDHVAAYPEDLEAFARFFTEPLTRHQINHLIRTLKRARDAAYGADE